MLVLGVDPGSRHTGYGVIEVNGNKLKHVAHGVISPPPKAEFSSRLFVLFEGLSEVIQRYRPDEAAMEDVFMAKNAASALKLGQARGALIVSCVQAGLNVSPYSPTAVKQALVGFGRAEKAQIQHMVSLLIKPPGKLQEDAADALAVAICHAHHAPAKALRENAA